MALDNAARRWSNRAPEPSNRRLPAPVTAARPRWDIFCSVVDNYGDAGVCWRLARQLATEHTLAVRLWVDALPVLARMVPEIDRMRGAQTAHGVTVYRWGGPKGDFVDANIGDIVVEAFGCGLPDALLAAMAARDPKPVWINLEYLSAEAWIEGCHGLASRHPQLPLVRHFFFPGFTAATGGLPRERHLFAQRDAFQRDPSAQAALWASLGAPQRSGDELRLSLFCYPSAALPALLDVWAGGGVPITCIVPEGVAAAALDRWTRGALPQSGAPAFIAGRLTLAVVPFVAQDEYDRLLWACDVNFVRGEDSFVRAQWAARPLVWHAYPQADDAHRSKLDAFFARYGADLAPETTVASAFSRAWNEGGDAASPWPAFASALPALEAHARRWADGLAQQSDLATALVTFAEDRV